MKSLDIVTEIREALVNLKSSGQDNIPIKNLEAYINNVERIVLSSSTQDATLKEQQLKQLQQEFESNMEVFRANRQGSLEMFKSVIEAGMNALKSAIIINGGAAVALLALISEITKNSQSGTEVTQLGFSLFIFIVATGCAGVATGTRYLAQFVYGAHYESVISGKPNNHLGYLGHLINFLTIALGTISFIGFFCGGWHAYQALVR